MVAFHEHFVTDNMAVLLKLFVFGITFAIYVYVYEYLIKHHINRGEYYLLSLFSVLGICVLISAHSLLTLYLGLELLSLPLYALVALAKQRNVSSEAAMKYFVMGALASGMLLYGISLVYGATGSLSMDVLSQALIEQQSIGLLLMLGLVFMSIGVAFKFGAVPFHLWIPDVYQGASLAVVLFISTAPKLGAFGMLLRIFHELFAGLDMQWQPIFGVMAVLSLLLGNIVAVVQTNIKRMLGYSAISHVGFIFLAIYAGHFSVGLYYVIVYALMTAAAFGILAVLSSQGVEVEEINELRGLDKRHRWLALMMLLVMFSLAGIPPSIGFYAKLTVLNVLVSGNDIFLASLALLMSVVGAYYYLRVVKVMYFDEPMNKDPLNIPMGAQVLLSGHALSTWVLGIFPGPLLTLCANLF
jgi:NADH-quinone oxidoreductase subunit N